MAPVYRALAIALLGLGLAIAGPVGGQSEQASEQETRARLERLQRDIKEINAEISRDNKRKSKLQEQLRQAEVELGELRRNVDRRRPEGFQPQWRADGVDVPGATAAT